jgi:hypothetical protein
MGMPDDTGGLRVALVEYRPPTGSWLNATQSIGGRLPRLHFDAFNALFDAHVEHKNKSILGKNR